MLGLHQGPWEKRNLIMPQCFRLYNSLPLKSCGYLCPYIIWCLPFSLVLKILLHLQFFLFSRSVCRMNSFASIKEEKNNFILQTAAELTSHLKNYHIIENGPQQWINNDFIHLIQWSGSWKEMSCPHRNVWFDHFHMISIL